MTEFPVASVRRALDVVRARSDLRERRGADPVEFVHRYASAEDRELVALVAASAAFGNVKAIFAKLEDLFARVGPSPALAADDARALARRLRGWKHRLFLGEDMAGLLIGARRVQRSSKTLGHAFVAELERADGAIADENEAVREALAGLCDRIRIAGSLARTNREGRRGPAHLLPDPRSGSAAKRLMLFLRWMIRPADGIDVGLWSVPARRLLVPVDVHIHKLSRNLAFTDRSDVSFRTAVEITRALARLCPEDPVRYDFSLCHLGMLQRCPSRRDPVRCEGCGVKPVCRHWRKLRRTT